MARNTYPGECYRCKEWVPAGEGHFERLGAHWRVQHAACAIEHRGEPDPVRTEHSNRVRAVKAAGTGRRAQRARKTLRDLGILPPAESGVEVAAPQAGAPAAPATAETLLPNPQHTQGETHE